MSPGVFPFPTKSGSPWRSTAEQRLAPDTSPVDATFEAAFGFVLLVGSISPERRLVSSSVGFSPTAAALPATLPAAAPPTDKPKATAKCTPTPLIAGILSFRISSSSQPPQDSGLYFGNCFLLGKPGLMSASPNTDAAGTPSPIVVFSRNLFL